MRLQVDRHLSKKPAPTRATSTHTCENRHFLATLKILHTRKVFYTRSKIICLRRYKFATAMVTGIRCSAPSISKGRLSLLV